MWTPASEPRQAEKGAVAGLSMGGFVAMQTGLSHLDMFSELYVFSSGHFPDVLAQFEERFQTLFEDAETNNKFRVPFCMAQGGTDIALRNGQSVMAIISKYGLRNFRVLRSGGHEWANWRRYLHQAAQVMVPDCDRSPSAPLARRVCTRFWAASPSLTR